MHKTSHRLLTIHLQNETTLFIDDDEFLTRTRKVPATPSRIRREARRRVHREASGENRNFDQQQTPA